MQQSSLSANEIMTEIPDLDQPCISIRDLEEATTEIYLNFIDLDKDFSLEFVLGQLTVLRDLSKSAGASDTTAAEEIMGICRRLDEEKRVLMHGGVV